MDIFLAGGGGDAEARKHAERADDRARVLSGRVRELEERVDRLALVSQALWELLSEQTGLTGEQVLARMAEVDLRDGVADGRMSRESVAECAACGRLTRSARRRCLYCGDTLPAPRADDPLFG